MPDLTVNRKHAKSTKVALGDVVDVVNDYWDRDATTPERLVAGEHIDEGDMRIRRWGMTDDDLIPPTFNRRFRAGDALLHSRNIKKVAQPNFGGITGEKLFILRSKDTSIFLQELVPYLIGSEGFRRYAESRWAGSTNKFLNKTPLMEFEFALPPLKQQRRHVSALMAARDLCERSRDIVERGDRLRDALIAHLIECGSAAESRRDSAMGRFPGSWDLLPLGDRYEIKLGKMLSPKTRYGNSQVPYLRNANVQWGRLHLSDVATMSIAEEERERFGLRPGDILACEGRHVGKSVIWNDEIPGACYQKALHRLRPHDPDTDLPEYMLLCLRLYSVSGRFIRATGATTIPHLPADRFRKIVFPFPSLDEQRLICDTVRRLEEQISSARSRATIANRVLRAVVDEAAFA